MSRVRSSLRLPGGAALPGAIGLLLFAAIGPVSGDRPPAKDGGTKAKPAAAPAAPAPAAPHPRKVQSEDEMGDIETPPPPFSDDVFPCTNCHEKGSEADPTRREVSQHDFKFEHDAEHRWCYDCHAQE